MDFEADIHARAARARACTRIAICGGGAAAILLLRALKQHAPRPVDVLIFEPRSRLGVGLAYSTSCPAHLLNTRACNMSLTDDPDDFVRWLRTQRPRGILNWTGEDFAPRSYFADYLQTHLEHLRSAANIRVRWLHCTADSVNALDNGWEVVPAHGEPLVVDIVVLATGTEPRRSLGTQLPPAARRLIVEDPWDSEQKAQIPDRGPVILAGTGLTAVDIATELLQGGHSGPIIAVSRRGLLPRVHGPIAAAPDGSVLAAPTSLRALVRYVRQLSADDPRGEKWRRVFTELRAMAPSVWRGWSLAEKRRFLRHVRLFWDVHRHRLPPRVHARITQAINSGKLIILKGRIAHVEPLGSDRLRVSVRHARGTQTIDVTRIVNCTGPETHPARSQNPLLQALIGDGTARADATGLGVAVDSELQVVSANGSAHAGLYAVGSLTRGTRWEVTSIPELRLQANAVVRHAFFGARARSQSLRSRSAA